MSKNELTLGLILGVFFIGSLILLALSGVIEQKKCQKTVSGVINGEVIYMCVEDVK